MEQGNSMNTGYGQSADIMSTFIQQLNGSFKRLEDELRAVVTSMGGQQKLIQQLVDATKKSNKELDNLSETSDDFLRSFNRSLKDDSKYDPKKIISTLLNDIEKQIKSSSIEKTRLTSSQTIGRPGSLANVKTQETSKEYSRYIEALNSLSEEIKNMSQQGTYFSSQVDALKIVQNTLSKDLKERQTLQQKLNAGTATESDKQRMQDLNKEIQKNTETQKQTESELEGLIKEVSDKIKAQQDATREAIDNIKDSFEDLEKLNDIKDSRLAEVAKFSPIFARMLEKQEKQSYNDQFREAVNNATAVIDKTIKTLEERISTAQGEEKEELEQQLKSARKQESYLKNMNSSMKTGLKDAWVGFARSSAGAVLNVVSGAINGLIDSLENRYLDTYSEGFDRVYSSIENTRNSISARLKLDQGGFEDIQKDIKQEIDTMGISGSISLVDVNDALVALSSAGVTDQETLKALAIESAKLAASGSSINLQNEETITNLLAQIGENQRNGLSKQDAISAALEPFDSLEGTIQSLREEYGQDIALVNGGIDAIINEQMTQGRTLGLTNEQIAQNLRDAVVAATSLQSYAIDPTLLQNMVKDLRNADVSNLTAAQAVMYERGLDIENLGNLSIPEQYDKVLSVLSDAMANASEMEMQPVLQAYGISMTTDEAINVQKHLSDIQTSATKDLMESSEAWMKKIDEDLKKGTYMSRTEQVNTEYENKMTDTALFAEQYYEGGEMVRKQIDNISTGVKTIVQLLETAIIASGSSMFKGLFGGGGAGAEGSGGYSYGGVSYGTNNMSFGKGMLKNLNSPVGASGGSGNWMADFATGAKGTTAGKIGRGLSIGVGALETGYGFVQSLRRDENGDIEWTQTTNEFLSNKNTWKGIGTAVAGAVGGPVAGAIVGELMGASAELGKKWGESWKTQAEIEAEAEAKTIKKYQDAADDQLQAATEALDAAKQQKEAAQTMSDAQKRSELIKTYGLSYSDVKGMSSEELSNKLDELTSAKEAEKEAEVVSASMVDKYSDAAGRVQNLETPVETYDRRTNQYTTAPKIGAISYIDWSGEGSKRKEGFASLQGEKALIDVLGNDEQGNSLLYQMSSDIEDIQRINPEKSTQDILKEWFPDADESVISNIDYFVTTIMPERKKKYDVANETFHNRWKEASKLAKTQDPEDIYWAYVNELDPLKYPNASKLSRSVVEDPSNWNDELNMPNLDTGGGSYNELAYVDKFKSGIADVPYDGYPAVLHTGERVLTKREAEVYNSIVPDIVEAVTTDNYFKTDRSSSNVMSTNIYGNDELKTEISDQTNSLTSVLNKILEILQSLQRTTQIRVASGINPSILSMNSNVTQITTSS